MSGGNFQNRLSKSVWIAIATTLSSVVVLILSYSDGSPATCLSTSCFCEANNLNSLFVQPSNSLSSLFFCIGGLIILFDRNSHDKDGQRIIFAVSSFLIGIGSFGLHSTLSFNGQFFDNIAMYVIPILVLVYSYEKTGKYIPFSSSIIFLILMLMCTGAFYLFPEIRRTLFFVLVVIAIIFEMRVMYLDQRFGYKQTLWFFAAILSIAIGFSFWILDNEKILCYPDSLFQGHGLWHFSGALSVYLLYRYYRRIDVLGKSELAEIE